MFGLGDILQIVLESFEFLGPNEMSLFHRSTSSVSIFGLHLLNNKDDYIVHLLNFVHPYLQC